MDINTQTQIQNPAGVNVNSDINRDQGNMQNIPAPPSIPSAQGCSEAPSQGLDTPSQKQLNPLGAQGLPLQTKVAPLQSQSEPVQSDLAKTKAPKINFGNFVIPTKGSNENVVIESPASSAAQVSEIAKVEKPNEKGINIPIVSISNNNESDNVSKKETGSYSLTESEPTDEDKQIDPRTPRSDPVPFVKNVDIAALVSQISNDAVFSRTSDIHIEPYEKFLSIRFRIDGEFYEYRNFAKEYSDLILTRIQVLAGLKIDELRKPQDGKISAGIIDGKRIDMRISTLPTIYGNKIVIRILEKENRIITLPELGYDHNAVKLIYKNLARTYGMILMSGPTGSGKSTTLFAMISKFDPFKYNISTLEDPVEYFIEGANQSQVNAEIGFDFGNGLRSLVRQDPDIIMVGEIRDNITAVLSTQAAITGHLVFSTVHANNTSSTIQRLTNMGADPFLVADALNIIIAQRLLKKNCANCLEEYTPTMRQVKYVQYVIDKLDNESKGQVKFIKGKGCDKCHGSGYSGRLAIYEILEITNKIKSVIIEKKGVAQEIEKVAIEEGMVTIQENGIMQALKGKTTIEEVMMVTDSAE